MEILYARCAGLDVHKESVSACVLTPGSEGEPLKEIRQFGTTTGELRQLRDWLSAHGVTHAAMESTGVYWKPVFNILESGCELILVNARHIKQVPGRKTDKADSRNLNVYLDRIWQRHFSDILRVNEVEIAYCQPWKRRLGLIRMIVDNKTSFIGINALLQHWHTGKCRNLYSLRQLRTN
jgi:transposase